MKETFSLEEEMKKLERIEESFQQPSLNLEEAIKKHEEALKIAKAILQHLAKAESTVQKLDLRALSKETDPEN